MYSHSCLACSLPRPLPAGVWQRTQGIHACTSAACTIANADCCTTANCWRLQDTLARFKSTHGTSNWELLPEKAQFQLNDTHPTMAMAELTRLLVDTEGLPWEQAVKLTSRTLNFTNHTVMPEALEKWPVKVRREAVASLSRASQQHVELRDNVSSRMQTFVANVCCSKNMGDACLLGYGCSP